MITPNTKLVQSEFLAACGLCEGSVPALQPVRCTSLDCPITYARYRLAQALGHAAHSLNDAATISAQDNDLVDLLRSSRLIPQQRASLAHELRAAGSSLSSSSSSSSDMGADWHDAADDDEPAEEEDAGD